MIDKIDAEIKELYLLNAVNCNLLPEVNVHISVFVTGILDINGRCQLITQPRGVTPVSRALIGLCITLPRAGYKHGLRSP